MKHSKLLSVLILIASALLLSIATSTSALPPNTEKGERSAKPQKRSAESKNQATPQACPSVTVIIREIPAPEAKQITAAIQQEPHEHWWQAANAPQWALFFLTIPYVLVTGGLFIATRRQAKIAEEALLLNIRPRISIRFEGTSFGQRSTGGPDLQFIVSYIVKNTGPSPAYMIDQSHAFVFTDEPLPPKPPRPADEVPIKGIIEGNSEIQADSRSEFLSPQKMTQINEAKLLVFLLMLIVYKDERTKEHRSRMCSVWNPYVNRWIVPKNIPDTYYEAT